MTRPQLIKDQMLQPPASVPEDAGAGDRGSQTGSQDTRHGPTSGDYDRAIVLVTGHVPTAIDTLSPTTDQKVGGSNPSERAT